MILRFYYVSVQFTIEGTHGVLHIPFMSISYVEIKTHTTTLAQPRSSFNSFEPSCCVKGNIFYGSFSKTKFRLSRLNLKSD